MPGWDRFRFPDLKYFLKVYKYSSSNVSVNLQKHGVAPDKVQPSPTMVNCPLNTRAHTVRFGEIQSAFTNNCILLLIRLMLKFLVHLLPTSVL